MSKDVINETHHALRYYGDVCRPAEGQHDLHALTVEVVSRLPDEVRDWLSDSGTVFVGGSGQLGEFIEVCLPASEVREGLVTLRVIYLAEKLMSEPRVEAVHTIAHEVAHAYLAAHGDPDHEWGGGYDAEVKADALVASWGFPEPPGRAEAREAYRVPLPRASVPPEPPVEEKDAEEQITVSVRRQWNDYRTLNVPLGDLWDFHWRQVSGGVGQRLPRPFLHARMWCSSIPEGSDFPHSCLRGPPPHAILVCVCKKDNRAAFDRLCELARKDSA